MALGAVVVNIFQELEVEVVDISLGLEVEEVVGVMAHILQVEEHTLVTFHSLIEDDMALVEEDHKYQLVQLKAGHSPQL